jgi:nephrocystin-3
MNAEGDYLVKVVLPELREHCRQRHIQLIDVELRWGVTKERSEGGGALDICLDEINLCQPLFLGLRGHRYWATLSGQEQSITALSINIPQDR